MTIYSNVGSLGIAVVKPYMGVTWHTIDNLQDPGKCVGRYGQG